MMMKILFVVFVAVVSAAFGDVKMDDEFLDNPPDDFDPQMLGDLSKFNMDPSGMGAEGDGFNFDDMDIDMGQFSGMNFGSKFEANMTQIKYITCPVCKAMVSSAHHLVSRISNEFIKKKMTQFDVDELLEDICELPIGKNYVKDFQPGGWMRHFQILELEENEGKDFGKKYLALGSTDPENIEEISATYEPQPCTNDCYTIGYKCKELMSSIGSELVEQLSVFIRKGILTTPESRDTLINRICSLELKNAGVKNRCGKRKSYIREGAPSSTKQDL